MVTLGIVGGIGSGKSWVSNYLAQKGCCWFDADQVTHRILDSGEFSIVEQLRARWLINNSGFATREGLPRSQILIDGKLSRPNIASIVFNFPTELRFLEAVLKPHLDRQLNSFLADIAEDFIPIVIIDAPLLYEIGWESKCNRVLFVDSSMENRIARLALRVGFSKEEAEKNIELRESALTIPLLVKKKRASFIFSNNGDTLEDLDRIFDDLKKLSCSNIQNRYLWD